MVFYAFIPHKSEKVPTTNIHVKLTYCTEIGPSRMFDFGPIVVLLQVSKFGQLTKRGDLPLKIGLSGRSPE
jgi:hypothetical protein